MKVLVMGGGDKEHAIVWKLSQSKHVNKIFCCPGNAGIAEIAECIDISPNDLSAIIDFVKYEWIDLTVVGSEKILETGIVNAFQREGCKILGPDRTTLQIRSRVFTKNLMRQYRIPTTEYKVFTSYLHAQDYVRLKGTPIVIKPDGYSGENGSFVADSVEEAIDVLKQIMKDRIFGDAGRQVIIEEYLKGARLSFVALTDGKVVIPLTSLYNYRQKTDDSLMRSATQVVGSYSPVPAFTKDIETMIMGTLMRPLLKAFTLEGIKYKGFISVDLLLDKDRVKVLELHCWFGDLESQTILPRIKTDFIEIIMAVIEERLFDVEIEWEQGSSVCVVMSSMTGLQKQKTGVVIKGLEKTIPANDIFIFHDNTLFHNADIVTTGGRAVCITAVGTDLLNARTKAYSIIENIHFEGMYYRNDIGNNIVMNI